MGNLKTTKIVTDRFEFSVDHADGNSVVVMQVSVDGTSSGICILRNEIEDFIRHLREFVD